MVPPVKTAQEIIDYEISLGNKDVQPYPGVDPTKVAASNLYWVTFAPEHSQEYEIKTTQCARGRKPLELLLLMDTTAI